MYSGIIIEESLQNKSIFDRIKIASTKIEEVTEKHKTPWLKQWTLHTVEIQEDRVGELAEEIRQSLDQSHSGSWYADFKNDSHHYIIFPNKVFFIDRSKKEEYDEATRYGISLGIPDHQVDFSPHVKNWKR